MSTVEINISETRNGNQERTIQRNWQHWAQKTHKRRQGKQKPQNTYNYNVDQHYTLQKPGVNQDTTMPIIRSI